MSTENFVDTQEKAQLVRDFLMDSKTFRNYGIINDNEINCKLYAMTQTKKFLLLWDLEQVFKEKCNFTRETIGFLDSIRQTVIQVVWVWL